MLPSASTVCPTPKRRNAEAKDRNSPSLVRRQKRRKKQEQTRNPRATAPDRKSYSVIALAFLHFPHETPDQRRRRGECEEQSRQPQVDFRARPHDQVEHQRKVVQRKEHETDAAPQQQARAIGEIAPPEQPGAGRAGEEAENV